MQIIGFIMVLLVFAILIAARPPAVLIFACLLAAAMGVLSAIYVKAETIQWTTYERDCSAKRAFAAVCPMKLKVHSRSYF